MIKKVTEDKIQYTLTQQLVGDVDGWPIYMAAFQAVMKAREEGQSSGKHPPNSWMEEDILNQIGHTIGHVDNLHMKWLMKDTFNLEEAEHALCRLAIAIALYKKEQENVLPN